MAIVPGTTAANDTRLMISRFGATGGFGGGGEGSGDGGGGEEHWASNTLRRHVRGGRSGGGAQRASVQLGAAGGEQRSLIPQVEGEEEGEGAVGEQRASIPHDGAAGGGDGGEQRASTPHEGSSDGGDCCEQRSSSHSTDSGVGAGGAQRELWQVSLNARVAQSAESHSGS